MQTDEAVKLQNKMCPDDVAFREPFIIEVNYHVSYTVTPTISFPVVLFSVFMSMNMLTGG